MIYLATKQFSYAVKGISVVTVPSGEVDIAALGLTDCIERLLELGMVDEIGSGAEITSKAELVSYAESVGIKLDKRKSIKNMISEIEEAANEH
jgi:hypothetical protein